MTLIPSYESGSELHGGPKLADISPFASSLRNMSTNATNNAITLLHKPTLAARLKPAAMGWAGEGCWEYEVGMANALNADLYVNTSYFAEADYIEAQAIFVRDNLNAGLKTRPEFSNENWQVGNAAFYQGILLDQESTAAGISRIQMQARKHREMMEIWEDVFAGQTHRLIGVFAWQTFISIAEWTSALNFENCYQHVGEISTGPYHSSNVLDYAYASTALKAAVTAEDYNAFVAALRTDMTAAIATAVSGVKTLWDWLPSYNLSKGLASDAILMNSYEANHHVGVRGSWADIELVKGYWNDFKASFNMSDMTVLYIDSMNAECPHHMFMFDYAGGISRTPAFREVSGEGWDLMMKTGDTAAHSMDAVIERAEHYNAL